MATTAKKTVAKKSATAQKKATKVKEVKKSNIVRFDLHKKLEEYFGFTKFKGTQEKAIESILAGHDTFVIMPTGGGKSLCYQLPAMVSEGVAIIVSPLIALMKNQVDLVRGYSSNDEVAHFLNSTLTKKEIKEVHDDLLAGKTKMLYVAPETLTKQDNLEFFSDLLCSR
jgi:ATP-dependent DNA helicase RecQ